ncbi:LacI family DNA-binding transcriptional regulator [Curtobacterium ammoniigenes]|uniref:LacI family DNA-binding transcriptional regulator n=1 Tax=Curtobacterium ammoniigenes TaxID=395387 RepID=UPI00082E5410|nr:LacI family DNA-binding transcriptional regulator [Curtobacterium ammoniigenes]
MSRPDASPTPLTPKISDVAARAEVSLSTVSRVMNGSTRVNSALAERVHAAAQALGYSPSPLARSLVLGKTQTVAVVVPDLGNPIFQGALRGLSTAASRDGYHVLVADSQERVEEERLLTVDARRRCDGIVLCAPRMPDDELAALLPMLAPAVLINREAVGSSAPAVRADYRSGLLQILQHLFDYGHRDLVYLAGSEKAASNRHRLAAIAEFSESHDVRIDIVPCGTGFEDGYRAADAVLEHAATAVLAFNDLVAMGLLGALAERGVRVPDEISVAGFDDIPFARYTAPPLTTATVPTAELGEQAWQRMAALLEQRSPGHDLTFGPRVVPRRSTGPAPERTPAP